jgi:F-type H+-transporting ATPase subunit gamma
MTQARPYAVMLASVLASLRRRMGSADPSHRDMLSPLLQVRPEKNILLVMITGDKGFAGAFSTNIVRTSTQFIREQLQSDRNKRVDVLAIGRKGRDFVRRTYAAAQFGKTPEPQPDESAAPRPERHRKDDVEYVPSEAAAKVLLDKLTFEQVRVVGEEIVERYAAGEIDAVYLAYNQFRSVISQRVVVERILPLVTDEEGKIAEPEVAATTEQTDDERQAAAEAAMNAGLSLRDDEQESIRAQYEDEAKRFGTANVDYLYDQSEEDVYDLLLPRFVPALLYYASLESVASEHAARMTAMDAATSNASEMIDALTLTMNRVRQAAITKEIIEIVSGASAV